MTVQCSTLLPDKLYLILNFMDNNIPTLINCIYLSLSTNHSFIAHCTIGYRVQTVFMKLKIKFSYYRLKYNKYDHTRMCKIKILPFLLE